MDIGSISGAFDTRSRQGALDTSLCDVLCQVVVFFRYSISSINKSDRHDITGMLLKVALFYVKYILISWCMSKMSYT